MKQLELNQMEALEGGISGCGLLGIAGGILAIGILASPAGWIFMGGVAAAGFTTAGGIATAFAASFSVAGIGCGLKD